MLFSKKWGVIIVQITALSYLFSNPNNSIKTSYFLNLLLLPCSLASNLSLNRFIFLIGVVVLEPSSFEVGRSWGPEWVDSRSPPPYGGVLASEPQTHFHTNNISNCTGYCPYLCNARAHKLLSPIA